MDDIALHRKLQQCTDLGLSAVLITIVESKGSTPRGAGAKMILLENGKFMGTIGGGCVEGKIKKEALDIILYNHTSKVVTSYLNDKLGVTDGDICGGSLTVLLEYIPPAKEKTLQPS